MADEITKIDLFGQNRDGDVQGYTVASTAYYSKGTLMTLTGDNTMSARVIGTAVNQPIVGIASMDKAYDFSTRASVWDNGNFEGVASGAIALGSPVTATLGAVNRLQSGTGLAAASNAAIVGWATSLGSDGNTFTFRRKGFGAA